MTSLLRCGLRAALFAALMGPAAAPVRAQPAEPTEYVLASWTEKDGLPGSQIGSIAQDGDGYLWLATNAGLVRFDGVRFVEWLTIHPSGPPLAVASLRAARDGGIWIGLSGSGGVAHLRRGRLTLHAAAAGGPPPGTVRSLAEDRHGSLWAAGQFGVAIHRSGSWERLGSGAGLPPDAAYGVHEDRAGGIWVGTDVGVFHRPAGSGRFVHADEQIRVWAFADDHRNRMWITGLDHPFRLLQGPPPAAVSPAMLRAASGGWRLHHDSHGNMWVATLGAGVWRAHRLDAPGGPEIEQFTLGRLSSDVARSVIEDREGNIWVGTDNGLNRLSRSPLAALPEELATISRPVVALARGPDGALWAGTQNGLYRFASGRRERFDRRNGLPGVAIYALHVDHRGVLWAAGDHFGLAYLDGARFVPVLLPRTPSLRVVAMASGPDGALYLGDVDRGAFRWQNGTLTDLLPELPRKAAFSAMTDRAGSVWMGLAGGVLRAAPDGTITIFAGDRAPGGSVMTVYEDAHGTIWAGGAFGLSRFRDDGFVQVPLDTTVNRPNVTAIVDDDRSNLWLGLRAGVMRVDREVLDAFASGRTHAVGGTVYDMADGLHGVPIWLGFPTAFRSDAGALWFVTANGLARIDPGSVEKHRLPPPVLIESITADEEQLDPVEGLRLPPATSKLQIDYTALGLTVPSKVRFRYILEGFDRGWVEAGTRRQAFYTRLPPGSYRFRVAAQNDTVWNDAGASLDFSIAPTFYETAWFAALCVVLIGLAAWGGWRLRVRRERERFDLVLAERARMGREIHDTLLQSLVGVTLQFNGLASRLDPSAARLRRDLDRLRRQLEQCIREARQSILDLRSALSPAEDLGAAIRQMAAKQTQGTAVTFAIAVSGTPRACSARVRQQLLRIAQEGVVNAIRHAQAGHIRIELSYDDAAVTLRVADDGRGFDPAEPVFTPEDHWGLANMQERAEQIGAQFRLTSSPGAGTEIEAVVPLAAAG